MRRAGREEALAGAHRRIGRRLVSALNESEIDEQIFEVVSQWLLGPAFGRYDDGYRFGAFACALVSNRVCLISRGRR